MIKGFRPCPFCGTNNISLICGDSSRNVFEEGVKNTGHHCIGMQCTCGTEMWVYHEKKYDDALEHLKSKWNTRKRGKKDETK